ncbi:MAG: hypothetical protein ACXVCK_14640, partial [Bdellovibrionota bacterium]
MRPHFTRKISGAALFTALLLGGCGSSTRDRENYGDLSTAPNAIVLDDPAKHPHGWGRKDCLACHNVALNVHRRPGNGIDVDSLNRLIMNNGGSLYCQKC